MTFKWR